MARFERVFTRVAQSGGLLQGLASASQRRLAHALTARPERLLKLLGAPPRLSDTGAVLDRQLQLLIELSARFGHPDVDVLTPEQARAQLRMDAPSVAPEPAPLATVADITLAGPASRLAARVYRASNRPRQPALVFFHGGGWVIGDLDTHDRVCRALAHRAKCAVVSVEYRLAPEHPFPAAADDCHAAFQWVRAHAEELRFDPARIGVGGDSAGGNLSAVACLRARDAGGAVPALAVLIYPALDMTLSRPSHRTFERGFFLERAQIEWYRDHYARRDDWMRPDASPLFAKDVAGLPRTLVFTAGFDPLRDEAREYAERLVAAGVNASYRCHDALVHGYVVMAGVSRAAAAASEDIADAVRDAFAGR